MTLECRNKPRYELRMLTGPRGGKPHYLDFQATTPVDPRVFEKMRPYFSEDFGNPASQDHAWGWTAHRAVEAARLQVSELLGCKPAEIFFTSGATEANNWTVFGLVRLWRRENPTKKIHIITTEIEHKSVLAPLKYLQQEILDPNLFEVTLLPADRHGRVELAAFQKAWQPATQLLSLHWAHNELGTIQDIESIANWCAEKKIYFHSDATQAVGKLPIQLQQTKVDLLSFSGHKLYGPKGIGALYIRSLNPKVSIDPFIFGGSQEKSYRSGTLNVPGIVGLGFACELASREMLAENQKYGRLRKILLDGLTEIFPGLIINTHPEQHLPHALSLVIPWQKQVISNSLSNLAISSGSACTSGEMSGSPILKAIGLSEEQAQSTKRISIGRWTTEDDIADILSSFRLDAGLQY